MQQSNVSVSFGNNEISRSRIYDDDTRRQFEYSIASIADINNYGKREQELNNCRSDSLLKNSEIPDLRKRKYSVDRIKNKPEKAFRVNNPNDISNYSTDLKTYTGYPNEKKQTPINTSPCIEITYLKPAVSRQSAKFSKIKAGKINPPKSNFSIKKETEKKIRDHEEKLRGYIINAFKIDIDKNKYKISEKKKLRDMNEQQEQYYNNVEEGDYENYTNGENMREENQCVESPNNNMVVIGEKYPEKLNWSLGSKNRHKFTARQTSPASQSYYQGEKILDSTSKERRNIIRKYEKFYTNTKDFFFSNDHKVPSRCNFDEIISNVEDVRGSLERFKNENSKNKDKECYLLKDSVARHKKFKINERSYKPMYIEDEYRKKIEEKLEMLHLEIRNTMDNINKIENKDEKLNELINKSQNLSEILRNFSGRLQKDNEYDYENRNLEIYGLDSFEKTQNGFNEKLDIKKNDVDDVIEVLKGGVEIKEYSDKSQVFHNKNLNFEQTQGVMGNNINNNYSESYTNFKKMNETTRNFKNPEEYQQDSRYQLTNTNNNFNKMSETFNNTGFSNLDHVNLGQSLMNRTNDNNLFKQAINSQNTNNNIPANNSSSNFSPYNPPLSDSLIGDKNNLVYKNPNNQTPYLPSNKNYSNKFSSSIQNLGDINSLTNYKENKSFDPNNGVKKLKIDSKFNSESNIEKTYETLNPNSAISIQEYNFNVDTQNIRSDDKQRLTAYDIELPVEYYHKLTKKNQPPSEKDWCIRPHHLETFSKSENAIPDDLLNTKYISYYSPSELTKNEKSKEDQIGEIIESLESKVDSLKYELFQKSIKDDEFKQIYKKMNKIKEVAEKEYKSGKYKYVEQDRNYDRSKNLNENNLEPFFNNFEKNVNVDGKNLVINSYECLLDNLRNEEKELLISKRKEEFEKIRPPVDKWWEMKSRQFKQEMHRNKFVLNAPDKYFKKLEELKNNDLF